MEPIETVSLSKKKPHRNLSPPRDNLARRQPMYKPGEELYQKLNLAANLILDLAPRTVRKLISVV